jgi:hypothetical protein
MGVSMKGKGTDFIRHVNLKNPSAGNVSSPKNGSLCQITGSDDAQKQFFRMASTD